MQTTPLRYITGKLAEIIADVLLITNYYVLQTRKAFVGKKRLLLIFLNLQATTERITSISTVPFD